MLSYAPLEDDDTETKPLMIKKQPPPVKKTSKQECECVYLVMFFVFGAVILSLT